MTHQDFFRTFPAVAGDHLWQLHDDEVQLEQGDGRVTIRLGPERVRKIAGLSLPATQLEFEFSNQDQAQVTAFMARFDLSFRRGGG